MGIFITKENYLKQLAVDHPTVAHTVDGRRSFFRFNNEEEITAETLQGISYPCVAIKNIRGRLNDIDSAMVSTNHVFQNEWLFLSHVGLYTVDKGYTDDIQSAYDAALTIMEDFILAMKNEFEINGSCGAFFNFDLSKISYEPVGPMLNNEYGWRMSFEDEIPSTNINTGSPFNKIYRYTQITATVGDNSAYAPTEGELTYQHDDLIGATDLNFIIVNNANETILASDIEFDDETGTITRLTEWADGDQLIIPFNKLIST